MNLMEALTQEEIDNFNNYCSCYGTTYPISNYLDIAWATEKKTLYKLFGNQLILKYPVEFKVNENMLVKDFENAFVKNPSVIFMYEEFKALMRDVFFPGEELNDYDLWEKYYKYHKFSFYCQKEETENEAIKLYNFYEKVSDLLAPFGYCFRANQIDLNYWKSKEEDKFIAASIPNTNIKLKLTNKEKPFKFIKRIVKQCFRLADENKWNLERKNNLLEAIEEARIIQSQLLNIKALAGILCLSIYPIDFITMSDNDCGWSSCMSWEENGCYHMGTLEMLSSHNVVIAYLEAEKPCTRNYFNKEIKWSNKKWRELFIVDKEVIAGIKGYPYYHTELEQFCLTKLRKLAKINMDWDYMEGFFPARRFDIFDTDNPYEYKTFNVRTYMMYNDFGTDKAQCIVSEKFKEQLKEKGYVLPIGNPPYCVSCGNPIYLEDGEEDLIGDGVVCASCRGYSRCASCGRLITDDEGYYVDGEDICDSCFKNNYATCAICGELHPIDDAEYITIVGPTGSYIDTEKKFICPNCMTDYNFSIKDYTFPRVEFAANQDLAETMLKEANPNFNYFITWFETGNIFYNVLDPSLIPLLDCQFIEDLNTSLPIRDFNDFNIPKKWIKF